MHHRESLVQTPGTDMSSQEQPHEVVDTKMINDNSPKATTSSSEDNDRTPTNSPASSTNPVRRIDLSKADIEIDTQLKSSCADNPVVVSIHNLLPVGLEVYWVDYDGLERRFCSVPASHRMTVDTFETHVWKVYSSELNLERYYHTSAHPKQLCVIQQKDTSVDDCPPAEEAGISKTDTAEAEQQAATIPELQTAQAEEEKPIEEEKRVYDPKRCAECDKKLKLVSTHTCRCELNFCAKHRYAEEHNCTFDYRQNGKELLSEQNPLVESDNFRGTRL